MSDGQGTTTYSYDSSTEHRGLLTSENTGMGSAPSTFTGDYDAAGRLTSETYPNGIVATSTFDNDGEQTDLDYTGPGTGSSGLDYSADYTPQGQQADADGPVSAQTYTYDNDGRISVVTDQANGTCMTRVYGYDLDFNRTSLISQPDAGDGVCIAPGSTTSPATTHSYDAGDRLTDTGYSYDSLGRTLTVPAADAGGGGALTLGYYINDWVASEAQGTRTISYGLDATQNRVRTQADSSTGLTITDHYAASSGSPIWSALSSGTWTRNVTDLGGQLAAIQSSAGTAELQLPDLHGDITVTIPDSTTATAPDNVTDYTEFGSPDNFTTTTTLYGWEGTHRRATDSLNSLILMGQRLYDPTIGRFVQIDPVPGGSANNYDYVDQDPVNGSDLEGTCHWGNPFKRCRKHDDPDPYGPKHFCGTVGCINYQTDAASLRVQITVNQYGYTGGDFTHVRLYVNGKRFHGPLKFYEDGVFHSGYYANHGDHVTLKFSYHYSCWGFFTCTVHQVHNVYVVP